MGIWEEVMFRWAHDGWDTMMGLVPLQDEEETRALSLSLSTLLVSPFPYAHKQESCKDTVSQWWSTSRLQSPQPELNLWHLDLEPSSLRTMRSKWHFVQQPDWLMHHLSFKSQKEVPWWTRCVFKWKIKMTDKDYFISIESYFFYEWKSHPYNKIKCLLY